MTSLTPDPISTLPATARRLVEAWRVGRVQPAHFQALERALDAAETQTDVAPRQ